jgi:signal transduction histidine kinase
MAESPRRGHTPRAWRLHGWRRSLSTRFLLVVALVALLGVGTVALVINRVIAREFTLYVTQGGQMRAQEWAALVAEYYRQQGSWEGVGTLFSQYTPGRGRGPGPGPGPGSGLGPGAQRILVLDSAGQIVYDSYQTLVGESVDPADQARGVPVTVAGQQVGTVLVTTGDLSGRSDLERRFLAVTNRAVVWAVLLVAAASLIAAALLSRRLVAPLRQLTAAAEAMAEGDLSQRVQVRTRDETGELAQAFNQMAADLESAERQRRQMTADIAHELRNPLSVVRGNLEAMFDGVYPIDAEHLEPIYQETVLLQRLVEDLRLLTLADAGQLELICSDVDVERLLRGVRESAAAIAQDKGVSLRVDVQYDPLQGGEHLVVYADEDRLRQVLGNLMSNALRYTPAGGTVTLGARRISGGAGADAGGVRLTVSDTGPGIPPQDLPHVFDRFYRGDAARDRASGGSGLGLAIARALVEAHGGTIEVQSELGKGTVVVVGLV